MNTSQTYNEKTHDASFIDERTKKSDERTNFIDERQIC